MDRPREAPRRRPAPPRAGALAFAVVAALGLADGAGARPRVDWLAELGTEVSDNVERREDGGSVELILVPRIEGKLRHGGARVKAEVDAELEHRRYLGHAFGSEFRGGLDAVVDWAIFPERLHWIFEDRLSLEPVDLFGQDSPDNVQHVNVFRTGPTLTLRPAPNWRAVADLRFVDSYAQTNKAFDSRRGELGARLEWRASATSEYHLQAEVFDVRRDAAFDFGDYRRHDLYAAHLRRLARFDVELDAGRTEVEFRDGLSDDQPYARGAVTWRIDPRSSLRASARRGYADSTDALIGDPQFEGLPPEQIAGLITVAPDVYSERSVELRYLRRTDFGTLTVRPFARDLRYLRTPTLDQRNRGGWVDWRWQVGEGWILSATAVLDRRDYENLARRDRDAVFGLGVERRFNSRWSARAALARRSRESDANGQSYDENVLLLAAVYRGR